MCGHTLYLAQPLFRSVPSLASGFDVGGALGRPDKPTPPHFRSVGAGAGRPGGAGGSRTAGGAPDGDAGAVGAARPTGPLCRVRVPSGAPGVWSNETRVVAAG